MTDRDLTVPRPLDQATAVPLGPHDDLAGLDEAKILAAPTDPADWPAWRAALHRWRTSAVARIGYRGPDYPTWTAQCRVPVLVWLWDERLYDRGRRRFTVEEFLATTTETYGGVDAVVLWHAYPVIGIDERNQWDYYRLVPELAEVVARFQAAGVQVFCDYNPWDVGTRRSDRSDADELAALVADYGFDGVFLDTLKEGAPAIRAALGPAVALEGESRVPLASVAEHALSWAQWFADSDDDGGPPGVLRAHWFERRHMMHHTRRWNRDHSAELQSAWVNGVGVLVWDDVFGVWVGWNARDRATLSRMRVLQRTYADVFARGDWTPLVPVRPEAVGIFAHRYELEGVTVWALVNRTDRDYSGPIVEDRVGCVPARGIAALVDGAPMPALPAPVDDPAFPARTVIAVPGPAASTVVAPAGTVRLPAGRHRLDVTYRVRETGQADEARWVDAWKPLPPELHSVETRTNDVEISGVAVDELEVSVRQYAAFARATGRPVPTGDDDAAVTEVSLDDARAYAVWCGGRLPTPGEWQLAQRHGAGRRVPLVWNWTDSERTDGITRSVLLKGGSDYVADGSDWYVDGGPQDPSWELKLVLPGEVLQRSARIGFRCAYEVAP